MSGQRKDKSECRRMEEANQGAVARRFWGTAVRVEGESESFGDA